MDDVWNTIEGLASNDARRALTTLDLPRPTQNGNGISNGNGIPNGNGISNGNGIPNGHHISNGVKASVQTNGTSHESISATQEPIQNGMTQEKPKETANNMRSYHAPSKYELLVWSAKDEANLNTVLQDHEQYFAANIQGSGHRLEQFAYTLAARRSVMNWRSFAVVGVDEVAERSARIRPAQAVRVFREKGVAFVLTGQGAQYVRMGLDLMRYPIFQSSLARADDVFSALGCEWSVIGKNCSLDLS